MEGKRVLTSGEYNLSIGNGEATCMMFRIEIMMENCDSSCQILGLSESMRILFAVRLEVRRIDNDH